ncbi:MAG: hypothetical protein DDT38_01036 [Firmicutes bacterium]|nr:hypothetical protein [candidate division NPL-UPA2 bacterium]
MEVAAAQNTVATNPEICVAAFAGGLHVKVAQATCDIPLHKANGHALKTQSLS